MARWFIGLTVAANAVAILALGLQRVLLERGPGLVSLGEWHRSVARVEAAAEFELLAFLVALVLFLRWVHLSYWNLRALDTQAMRFTPGWAVGYWFVPVLNIWRPAEVLGDLWRATEPGADRSGGGWRALRSSPLIGWWWALSLVAGPLEWMTSAMPAATLSELQNRNAILILGHVLELAAGACLFAVVGKLTKRQDAGAAAAGLEA